MKDLKIFTENIEQEAINQINTLMEQPAFSDCKIRIMPDVHAGAGCVIGFTADLGDKVIPNIVGVDIGCGMLTLGLGKIDIDYEKLDRVIRDYIPCGMNVTVKKENERHFNDPEFYTLRARQWIDELICKPWLKNIEWLEHSLCSLGGGNHFIEIDEGADGAKYLVIHTGSRNLGKQVADYYQKLAIDNFYDPGNKHRYIIEKLKAEGRELDIQKELMGVKHNRVTIPKVLCYLEGVERDNYLHDMRICQEFAMFNRAYISSEITYHMRWEGIGFHTIHNYIDLETNMVRKGAISAKLGEKVLIPINMRDGCIIGVGKGNDDWNQSAPHGAGRIMSRIKARETLSLDDFQDSMNGIYTTSVSADTIDEAPMVYKPMDEIVKNIEDTVDILEIIKPVYNFKASEV